MVRHIVAWNYRDTMSGDEKIEAGLRIKMLLEDLKERIDGIISIHVEINPLKSSNRCIILNSLFKDEAALKNYQVHPLHVKAGEYVRSVTIDRSCIDFVE